MSSIQRRYVQGNHRVRRVSNSAWVYHTRSVGCGKAAESVPRYAQYNEGSTGGSASEQVWYAAAVQRNQQVVVLGIGMRPIERGVARRQVGALAAAGSCRHTRWASIRTEYGPPGGEYTVMLPVTIPPVTRMRLVGNGGSSIRRPECRRVQNSSRCRCC